MAVSAYTYVNLKDQIADPIKFSNIGNELTVRNVINRAVRGVIGDVDLKSMKRRAALASKVFDDTYDYTCPADLNGYGIIDFIPQANRGVGTRLSFVDNATFDRNKANGGRSEVLQNMITITDSEFARKIRTNLDVDDTSITGATFDSTTAEGTWSAYGDVTNLVQDVDNAISGNSLKFDLVGSGTTAGLQNTTITALDLTDYVNNGSVFVWVYINSTTNLTNFILDIGNDLTTNYYTQTITTTNEGLAFKAGWNLLRFDFASMTENGTVTDTAIDSIRLYMTKTSGKNDDGYRFDHLTIHTGEYHDILYYSSYGWQTNAAVYIENSTADTDYVNADTEELEGFVFRGKYEVFKELKDYDQMKIAKQDYEEWKQVYERKHPSERLRKKSSYYHIS